MIYLSNAKEIKIDNIIIYGNIGIYDTEVVSITSTDIMGDIILNKIKDEFLIQNINFKPNSEITDNGYIITIKDCSKGTISDIIFDADISTKQVITIHDCYNLIIKNSNFNGSLDKMESIHEFHRVFAIYNSKRIELNNLYIQNFGDNTSDGYVMCISDSKSILISNCIIQDGFSVNTEMIKIKELSELDMKNITIHDIYSHMETSIIYNEGELNIDGLEFYNRNNYEKVIFDKKIYECDLVIMGNKQSKTVVNNSYFHDIKIKAIFIIKNNAKMIIKNTNIEKIDIYNFGAPFTTSYASNGEYLIDYVTLDDIHQKRKHEGGGLLIYLESSANINITNSKIENSISQGDTSRAIHMDTDKNNMVSLKNVTFSNVETKEYMINVSSGGFIDFYGVNFYNCSSEYGIIFILNDITNANYTYINVDGFNKNKTNNNAFFISSGSKEPTTLLNNEIKNSKFNTLIESYRSINTLGFNFTTIENNEFKISAIYVDPSNCSPIYLYKSKFISNIGEIGTIYHSNCSSGSMPHSIFNFTRFENNVARKYGGVIYYSKSKLNVDQIVNCTFYNNNAPLGSVCYSFSKYHIPYYFKEDVTNNRNNKLNKGTYYGDAFATNPTTIKCNKLEKNNYFSGDYIKKITCYLYDDYNNLYRSSENIDQLDLSEFIYFKIEASGSNNISLRGKTIGFCVGYECSIENIKGNKILNVINTF